MLKTRLIPVLLLKNGLLVRSEGFSTHQLIGNPIHEVERFNEWNVDELIYLDISRDNSYDSRRTDSKIAAMSDPLEILDRVSRTCFMPLTWGGRIRSVADMRARFARGADKVTLNTGAIERPELITEGAKVFGAQAIVVSIDVKRSEAGHEVFKRFGKEPTGMTPVEWAKKAADAGAGEILLQSVDEDGMAEGYDVELIRKVADAVDIPVIACSGVGGFEDYAEGVEAGASAVAAANLWHFKELADRAGKRALSRAGVAVRK